MQLDGFDIDNSQTAPKERLPANASDLILDCLGPLPEHLHKQHDIADIQILILAVARSGTHREERDKSTQSPYPYLTPCRLQIQGLIRMLMESQAVT